MADVQPTTEVAATPAAPVTAAGAPGSVEEALVAQVEFYLSDSNLPFDKFLFGLWSDSFHKPAAVITATAVPESTSSKLVKHADSKLDRFHQGWIPLAKITSFKRMSGYLEPAPTGLGGIDEVAKALEASTEVEAKKFGEEGQEGAGWYVRKTAELARPVDVLDRSIYAKGFPIEEPKDDSEEAKKAVRDAELDLQKRMENWARSLNAGKVLSLRMRREDKPATGDRKNTVKGGGKFKGSIFLEFANAESVAKFLAIDPKPTFEGAELEILSKSEYVEIKRQIHAPGTTKPAPGIPRQPGQPFNKGLKAYNAWALHLIGDKGLPAEIVPDQARAGRDDKKRKADDGPEEREILFDGVRFTARRTGGEGGQIDIVDEATVGTGEGGWVPGKLLKVSVKEDGPVASDRINFMELKSKIAPIVKPGYIGFPQKEDRPVAGLPGSAMAVDAPKSEFPTKLTAPPTIGVASATPAASTEAKDAVVAQASFKEDVTDEILEKIKSDFGSFEGRTLTWTRASVEDERAHILSRARWHAKAAFGEGRGESGGRGGRGGRGGARGGRGGARGGRGGGGRGGAKRPRRD